MRSTFHSKFWGLRAAKHDVAVADHGLPDWIRTCLSEALSVNPSLIKISTETDGSWINKFKDFCRKADERKMGLVAPSSRLTTTARWPGSIEMALHTCLTQNVDEKVLITL